MLELYRSIAAVSTNIWSDVRISDKTGVVTRKWWFFLLFILLYLVPPYTSKRYEATETGMTTVEILTYSIAFSYPSMYHLFDRSQSY